MLEDREIGKRVRRLRLVRGLGQIDFAKEVGIAVGSLSKLENGRMAVTDELLGAVAGALDCSPSFLQAPDLPVPPTRPWLRAYADASKRALDRQLADCTTAVEVIELLGLQRLPDALPLFRGDLDDEDEVESFALEVREAAGIEDGDVVGNAIRAVERLGCVVLPMGEELGRHLGMSTRVNLVPVICVSRPSLDPERHVPGDRQRHTVMHELGHLALHASVGPPDTAEGAARIEKQAHRFAGAVLAPGDAIVDELRERGGRTTLRVLAEIKENWGVSIKSLITRFRQLGVIDADHARSLYKQVSARGWNTAEPVPVGNEAAIWFSKALEKWAGGGTDSIAIAAGAAGVGRTHLDRWTDWSPTGSEPLSADVIAIETARSRRRTTVSS